MFIKSTHDDCYPLFTYKDVWAIVVLPVLIDDDAWEVDLALMLRMGSSRPIKFQKGTFSWIRINFKQSERWQHLSQSKASVFCS